MIRINLLPVRAKKKKTTSLYQLIAMSGAVAAALLIGLSVNAYYAGVVADQEKKIEESKEEIKRLQKIIGEVNELEKQKQRLVAQLGVIDKLEKGKRGPVHVLDELSTNIPKRVWITGFNETGGALNIKGAALDNADISEFMRSLQKSSYFGNVQLKYTQSDVRDGVPIFVFEVACSVNYSAT